MASQVLLLQLVFLLSVSVTMHFSSSMATLPAKFSYKSCPDLPAIVFSAVNDTADFDPVNLPALLRLQFHDAFVTGCDGSVLLDPINGVPSEKNSSLNLGLFGFDAIDYIKDVVDTACGPGVVSCADILALAARDAVVLSGGPTWTVPLGRLDGRRSLASDVPGNISTPDMSLSQLISNFANKNLSVTDLVALTGAHTIGFAHCASFTNRIYGFDTDFGQDPTMDPNFAQQLQAVCPQPPTYTDPDTVAPLDPYTFDKFDFVFYRNLRSNISVLGSDQKLTSDPKTKTLVNLFANNQASFFSAFTAAMIKLSQIDVIPANSTSNSTRVGEIRNNCRVPN